MRFRKLWKLWRKSNTEGRNQGWIRENIKEEIRDWLKEEGFNVREEWRRNHNFDFIVTKHRAPKFRVCQQRGESNVIFLETGMRFYGANNGFLRYLNLPAKLGLYLASKGFLYKTLPPDSNSGNLGGIVFWRILCYDNLSKSKFLTSISEVIQVFIFAALSIQQVISLASEQCNRDSDFYIS